MSMTERRSSSWWLLVIVLALGTVVAVAAGAWQLTIKSQHQPPLADQTEARQVVLTAARTNVAKVLSYQAATVEDDLAAAASVTTGEFGSQFADLSKNAIIPGARNHGTSTTATVAHAGIESLDAEQATVLVFLDLTTTKRAEPQPQLSQRAARVGLTNVDGAWLIERLQLL